MFLSEEEGREFIKLARNTIYQTLGIKEELPISSSFSKKKLGIFVTLYLEKELRGCIGSPYPTQPLEKMVEEFAISSATEDDRFSPISPDELEQIVIELSFLTPPKFLKADEIKIGVHGLLIREKGQAGLFLPKVAVEKGWSVETFLAQTCQKAGLKPDAWKKRARIEAFEAQVFLESR